MPPPTRIEGRQHLIVDADDTLWENNVYFERAFDEFIQYLAHSSMTPSEVRAVLDEIEVANSKIHGYGSLNFGRNLCQCFARLKARDICSEEIEAIMLLSRRIIEQPLELIEGVPETLEYLSRRHDMTLFTKGHPEEQKLKIDRSGLGIYFGRTAIVKEKDPESYKKLSTEIGLGNARTWMIGNSPKSDINPALQVGLNAVYVPHERTWHLERTKLGNGSGRLVTVAAFSELQHLF
jgi:putative hydrolase of the HAD superfamily